MFNPYQNYQGYFQPHQNILPQQQIIQVNGKASVDTIRLAPNSSILVMDTSAPIVWMCVSDGVGNVTSTPYDITVHQEISQSDTTSIEARLANIESMIIGIEEKINAKPNVKSVKSKSANAESDTD